MNSNLNKIAIIGGGSWATAIVKMLCDNLEEKEVFWWMRNQAAVDHICEFRHNPNYLSSVEIKVKPENVFTDVKKAIQNADMILLNVPAAFLKGTLEGITPEDLKGKKIISAIKGIVPDENQIIGEFMHA
jgi:glycerol-3-phosphate dehydrogenase (NAD(P)+)